MSTFEFFVDDSRYSVPTLLLITTDDESAARRHAKKLLDENDHYLGLEVWRAGERLWGLGTYAEPEMRARPSTTR